MKLVFTIIVCLTSHCATGQEFAPIGSEWYYTNIENPNFPDQGFVKIKSIADTIIQGKDCKRLTKTRYAPIGSATQESDEFLYTSDDTVFRLSDNDSFYILYNFAAQVGDTWTTRSYSVSIDEEIESVVQVDSIFSTIINGDTLKELFITSISGVMSFGFSWEPAGGQVRIIEKLGGNWYMFPQDFVISSDEKRVGLRCYYDSIIGQYNSGIVSDCEEKIYTANPELEFAPIGSEWYYSNLISFFGTDWRVVKIESIGDTVIQGITCKHLTSSWVNSPGTDEFLYTDGDIVYRLSDNDTFYILYNFAAQIGDTWTSRTYDWYAQKDVETTFLVEDISTTIINGKTLRELWVISVSGNMDYGSPGFTWGPQNLAHITERIGGGGFMLPQNYGLWDSNINFGLRCYNGPILGQNNFANVTNCESISTSINENILKQSEIKVFPNPTFDNINIETGISMETNIQLLDSTGRLILSKSSNDEVITLGLNPFPSGLYYLKIYNEKYSTIRKVVKR